MALDANITFQNYQTHSYGGMSNYGSCQNPFLNDRKLESCDNKNVRKILNATLYTKFKKLYIICLKPFSNFKKNNTGVAASDGELAFRYKAGDTFYITTEFSENVTLSANTSKLILDLGNNVEKKIELESSVNISGTNKLIYEYTVQAGDNSDVSTMTDGVKLLAIGSDIFDLSGATLLDNAQNDTTLTRADIHIRTHAGINKAKLFIDTMKLVT